MDRFPRTAFLVLLCGLALAPCGFLELVLHTPDRVGGTAAYAQTPNDLPSPTVSPEPPPDVDIPPTFPGNQVPIAFFDDYSWRLFLALNWPAVDGQRGVADSGKTLGDKSAAVVWETWKSGPEVFQPNGKPPSEWSSFETASVCAELDPASAGKKRMFAAFSKLGNVLAEFNEFDIGFPVGPLVAQNRTYVRFEIRLNEAEYNAILNNKWFLRANLPKAGISFPNTATVVKAAWKEFKLPDERGLLDRYYHVEALSWNPITKKCTSRTFALVGLHIVQKTDSRPQWIWSTFEHADNVTLGSGAPAGTKPTFNDPTGFQTGPTVNKPPNKIGPSTGSGFIDNPDPVQVVRELPKLETDPVVVQTLASTKATNQLYQTHPKVKDTVWANYALIRTQWPSQKKNPVGQGKPFPKRNVANVTMETYLQGNSCIQCHFGVQDSDTPTDFAWFLNLRAFPPSPDAAKKAAKDMVNTANPH